MVKTKGYPKRKSAIHRKHLSESMIRFFNSEKGKIWKQNSSKRQKNKLITEETKIRMRKGQKKFWSSERGNKERERRSLKSKEMWKKRKREKIIVTCLFCGKVIEVTPAGVGKKFCSRKCKVSFRKNKSFEEIYGKEKSAIIKTKMSQSMTGHRCSEQTKQKISRANTGSKTIGYCLTCNKKFLMTPHEAKVQRKKFCSLKCYGIYLRKLWKSSETRDEMTKKLLFNTLKRPTSYEQKIIDLCHRSHLPFKYVGNRQVIICYRNPDFIEINGKKLLIEIYDSYWHPKNYEESRSKIFSKYGFKTLFLNEKDICSLNWKNICLQKILNFLKENQMDSTKTSVS